MDLISIVVPIYNVEQYLDKCIESILKQTYENIEIILVNDGSTDNSANICNKYEKKDTRIKVIHKKNGGLSDARNIGINNAKGKYIIFIDSDDWIDINMVKNLYSISLKYNADIVQGEYIEAYKEDDIIKNNMNKEEIICNSDQMLESLYGDKYVKSVVVWNKIYKKDLFENIRFPKGKLNEDEFTTYKIFHKAKVIVDTDITVYYYRQREGSIMRSGFKKNRLDILEAFIERQEYFKINKMYKLEKITEARICGLLKYFYVVVNNSNIKNKKIILKEIKKEMKKRYIAFIRNNNINNSGKLTLTLCIFNGKLFCKIYNKYSM